MKNRLLKKLSAMLLCDFYKIAHRLMYPEKTEIISSTWTPRATRMKGVNGVVVAGNQAFIKEWLMDFFDDHFFGRSEEEVVEEYTRLVKFALGVQSPDASHIRDLHRLGYLPLSIKALPEGTVVPLRVPCLTITNTDPRFFWLTNYVETLASCELWPVYTGATIAREYRKRMDFWAMKTVGNTDGVMFQGHDFSMRGMMGLYAALKTGMGHLMSFVGTDTIPAILAIEAFYNANIEFELVGTSIPATEHSIQCTYPDDMSYFKNVIFRVHPSGFVSIVADGRDFWGVLKDTLPQLKQGIMDRKGGAIGDRVVIRPDSGDPIKIVCGDPDAPVGSLEYKGAVEVLWDIFGGTECQVINDNGDSTYSLKKYKLLDSHIGLIYGDAITLARAEEIMSRLAAKGFASTNCVFGIGSYTYQYNTRDTFGFALKTTAAVIDGKEVQVFKDPPTDNGIKKSQKGRVAVLKDGETLKFIDGLSLSDVIEGDQLVEIYRDGKLLVDEKWSDIKKRLAESKI